MVTRVDRSTLVALLLASFLIVMGGVPAQATVWLPPGVPDRVGELVPYPSPPPDCERHRSRSIGSPGNGRLVHGVLFPATGPDHFAWNWRTQRIGGSDRARWGHCRVVRAVLLGLAAYRDRNPGAPPAAAGDMALRHGGEIAGHVTHENGRQIDIYFPRRDRAHREPHAAAQVDMRLSRELVRAMLDAGADLVLIGPNIRIGALPRVIAWPHHDDHLHAIFY